MLADNYETLFNGLIDNKIFNCGILLSASKISDKDKYNILNDLAYKLQIEHQKKVYLIPDNIHFESELPIICQPYDCSNISKNFDRTNTIFLINTKLPYFEDPNNWNVKFINTLLYYFYPFFGFSSTRQIVKFYENI